MFQNFKIETLIKNKYSHYCKNIESKWTPIESIIKNMKIDKFNHFS